MNDTKISTHVSIVSGNGEGLVEFNHIEGHDDGRFFIATGASSTSMKLSVQEIEYATKVMSHAISNANNRKIKAQPL